MDQTLKKRLTGAAVLVVLAALVLPRIFDGANQKGLLDDTRLPPPPEVPAAVALLDAPPPELEAVEAAVAHEHRQAEPEPEVMPAPVVIPPTAVAPAPVAPAAAPEAAPVPKPAAPAAAKPAAPASAPARDPRLDALAEAWDVQVAALSSAENTSALVKKLKDAGYKVRVVRADGLNRVLVGPELRRDSAEKLRSRLAADARVGNLQGRLVRYVP